MPQIQRRPTPPRDHDDDVPGAAVIAAPLVRDQALDALLDDIDQVLDVNAEQFVRSFVQKGGQ